MVIKSSFRVLKSKKSGLYFSRCDSEPPPERGTFVDSIDSSDIKYGILPEIFTDECTLDYLYKTFNFEKHGFNDIEWKSIEIKIEE